MSGQPGESEVLDRHGAAAFLKLGLRTVDEWVRRGVLPSHKKGGRRLFLRHELIEWLKRSETA
ncbi:MAG: helix-turn-helix domain-containing protein [Phycisphaerales bacterium]